MESEKSLPDPFHRVRSLLTRARRLTTSAHNALGPNVQLPSPRVSALAPDAATVETDDRVELTVVTDVLVELDAIDGDVLIDVVVDVKLELVTAGMVLVAVELNTVEVDAVVVLGPDGGTALVCGTEFGDTMSRRALLRMGP